MKNKKHITKFSAIALAAAMVLTAVVSVSPLTAGRAQAAEGSAPRVVYRSEAEVKAFMAAHPISDLSESTYPAYYSSKPSYKAPYNLGALSDAAKTDALNALNQMRYIAGLDADVTWSSEYEDLAQGAALISAANGRLSHSPSQPSDMSDDLYAICKKGAGSCNLGSGYTTAGSVFIGYMDDSDSSNINRVGHRRWCLNPTMKKTAFGDAGYYTAMYAFDGTYEPTSTDSMWPGYNTPYDYLTENEYHNTAWSFSTGEAENESSVAVKLVNKKTGKTWNFSKSASPSDFWINNTNYGLQGAIIFRPVGMTYSGNSEDFEVTITGTSRGTIQYDVHLFATEEYIKNHSTDTSTDEGSSDNSNSNQNNNSQNNTNQSKTIPQLTAAKGSLAVYRLYNRNSGEHFYTTTYAEAQNTVNAGWKNESEKAAAWSAPINSLEVIYRLYNPNSGLHHYSASQTEINMLVKAGWKKEGTSFYSDTSHGVPVYREYNPNSGLHNYTTSLAEHNWLGTQGWRLEGVAWYGTKN